MFALVCQAVHGQKSLTSICLLFFFSLICFSSACGSQAVDDDDAWSVSTQLLLLQSVGNNKIFITDLYFISVLIYINTIKM